MSEAPETIFVRFSDVSNQVRKWSRTRFDKATVYTSTDTIGWQPIETAPKDGTDILVYVEKSGEQFVAFFHKDVWAFGLTETGQAIALRNPTKWRHLPTT